MPSFQTDGRRRAPLNSFRHAVGVMPESHVQQKLARVSDEIEAGRSWRAKEILQGCIATPYALEPEILEAYGKLLDSLGDRCEAGKYLFLCGQRDPEYPEYAEAIAVFLDRHRRAPASDLVALVPSRIRQAGLGSLPLAVQEELRARGATEETFRPSVPQPRSLAESPLVEKAMLGGCLTVVFLLGAIFLVGLKTVWSWLW